MSREWLALVEKRKRKLKFSPCSPSLSSFIFSPWQPLTIKYHSLYSCSFFRFYSFVASWPSIAPAAITPVLFAFFLASAPTTSITNLFSLPFFTNNNVSAPKRKHYPEELVPVNAGTVLGYNSGPFHFYTSSKYSNIWTDLAQGPNSYLKGSSRFGKAVCGKKCHASEVSTWVGMLPKGIGSLDHCLYGIRS